MTKYRLKDQELQRHLDAISDGAFSECLKVDLHFFEDGVTRINFGKNFGYASQFSVLILKDELEALPEYSPNGWNSYPDVTPPEGVPMRVERSDGSGLRAVYVWGQWRGDTDIPGFIELLGNVKRFRPWE